MQHNYAWKRRKQEKSDDALFVNNTMQQACSNVTLKLKSRTGLSEENKKPIKVVLHNEQDLEKILNNLQNLQDNTEYKGISITEDYIVSERQMIKEFANKAKEKNSLELENSNFVWKVRGAPKDGYFHESKGAIDYVELIETNTARESQPIYPVNITHQLVDTIKTYLKKKCYQNLVLWNYQNAVWKRER